MIADAVLAFFPIWLKKYRGVLYERIVMFASTVSMLRTYPFTCLSVRRPRTDLSYYVCMSNNNIRNIVYGDLIFVQIL